MTSIFSRYATPLISGLFIVSLVSGVALFFHFGSSYFHGMHEWLSLVLILPFVLHLWKNWRPFKTYFKRGPMAVSLIASLAAAMVFVVPVLTSDDGAGGSPQRVVFDVMQNGSVANLAPLFGHDAESMKTALAGKGLVVESADRTVREVAEASGKDTFNVRRVRFRRLRWTLSAFETCRHQTGSQINPVFPVSGYRQAPE